jgi:hypothetical protein
MGIARFFRVTVSGDTLADKKPHPAPLLHACARLAVPAAALMIGDSANDAEAARAAGMPVLLVTYGYSEGVPVDSIECDGLLSSLVDALPRIGADLHRTPSIVTRKRMFFVEEFPAVRIPSGGCGGRSWLLAEPPSRPPRGQPRRAAVIPSRKSIMPFRSLHDRSRIQRPGRPGL